MRDITTWGDDFSHRLPRSKARRGDYGYGVQNVFEVTGTVVARHFNIFLFGAIEDVRQFADAIEVMQMATENDMVEVHLSSPGGLMDATDTFLQAMHQCDARVVIRATGGCHSCASIILMHANEFSLSGNFNMLIHNGSAGGYGDLNKYAAQSKYTVEYMNKVLRETYEGFLTPEELQSMIDGKDFWMGGEEFMRRWYIRQELFKSRLKDQKLLGVDLEDEEAPEPVKTPRKRKPKTA